MPVRREPRTGPSCSGPRTATDVRAGAARPASPPATLVIHETDENGGDLPELAAALDGTDVGWITWSPSGTVAAIGVLEEYRHRGIATALWHAAQQRCPALRHDGEMITEDGLAFARTVEAPWSTTVPPEHPTLG